MSWCQHNQHFAMWSICGRHGNFVLHHILVICELEHFGYLN
uniref:Uncharacterized protein n=1 Tax=Rhizophora mucronata TaxID=61149 RepID=A0A2P2QSL7_RHIMU